MQQLGLLGCLAFQLESVDTPFLVLEFTKILLLLMHSLLNSTMNYPHSGGLDTHITHKVHRVLAVQAHIKCRACQTLPSA